MIRSLLIGPTARIIAGTLAGAALASRRNALAGALLGGEAAAGATWLTHEARTRAMRREGGDATNTGVVEDALTVTAAGLIARGRRSH